MSKLHVDKMAKAVKDYFAEAGIAEQKMKKISGIYRQEFIDSENKKIMEGLKAARQAAEAAIIDARESGRAEAAKWGELDGQKLSADAQLLQYDLTPEQYNQLVEKHRGNGTMAYLLRFYGQEHNEKLMNETGKPGEMPKVQYNYWDVPTVEEKQAAYDKFAAGAISILDRIDSPGQIGGGTDSQMLKLAIEGFGTPSNTSQELFDLL